MTQIIPLGYKLATTDEYTIQVTELNELEFDYIYLEDRNTDAIIDLFKHNEYSFIPENTEIENNRFLLHFGINHAPVIIKDISDQTTLEDDLFSLNIEEVFEDNDYQDVLTINATLNTNEPLPSWLTFNNNSLTFSGTPENTDVGIIKIKVIATDKFGETAETIFLLEVLNTDDAPLVNQEISNQTAYANLSYLFQFNENVFFDMDLGDILTYTAKENGQAGLPSWLNFQSEVRTFTGTPTNSDIGDYNIVVTATDIAGANISTSFILSVLPFTDVNNLTKDEYYIFPNPSAGLINIYNSKGFTDEEIIIRDITGKEVYNSSSLIWNEQRSFQIDLSNHGKGVYLISIINNTRIKNYRVVIE